MKRIERHTSRHWRQTQAGEEVATKESTTLKQSFDVLIDNMDSFENGYPLVNVSSDELRNLRDRVLSSIKRKNTQIHRLERLVMKMAINEQLMTNIATDISKLRQYFLPRETDRIDPDLFPRMTDEKGNPVFPQMFIAPDIAAEMKKRSEQVVEEVTRPLTPVPEQLEHPKFERQQAYCTETTTSSAAAE